MPRPRADFRPMPPLPDDETYELTPVPVRVVPLARPLRWLALGWRDFTRVPLPSALHGLIVAAGGLAIAALSLRHWYLLPGAITGFVLVAPILATGLYELSRKLEAHGEALFPDVVAAWRRGTRPLVWLGLILAVAGTAWVLLSAVLIAFFVQAPINGPEDVLRHIVLSRSSNLFWVWISLGGCGAALVFAITVVSVPLLLDRDVDMTSALAASVAAVGENPVALAFWATLIMIATLLSLCTAMIGFVIAIPVIGHASWHAYRDLVDASALPPRR